MHWFRVLIGSAIFFSFWILPFILVGLFLSGLNIYSIEQVLFGPVGIFAGIGIGLLLLSLFSSETVILKLHNKVEDAPPGVRAVLSDVFYELQEQGFAERLPPSVKLKVFQSPASQALVFKGFWGPSTLLLSQGLLSKAGEVQMRNIVRQGLVMSKLRGITLATLCGSLASMLINKAPADWVAAAFRAPHLSESKNTNYTPFSAIIFLMIFPITSLLLFLGRITNKSLSNIIPKTDFSKSPGSPPGAPATHPGLVSLYFLSEEA